MGKSMAKKIANLNKVLHPKSRKAAQLTKKLLKSTGREKVKHLRQMKMNIIGEKLLWFKENLEAVETYTPELTMKLIEKYLGRFNEELEQIKIKHSIGNRKGRQHANREDIIRMTVKNERNEFMTSGLEMPDILNQEQLKLLRTWSGELRFLQNFKLVRYSEKKLEKLKNSQQDSNKEVQIRQKEEQVEEKSEKDKEEGQMPEEKVEGKKRAKGETQMEVD